jgi:hypothetical protein
MVARIERMYQPELSMLPEAERSRLIVVGLLMDFESWGWMREGDGLSIEAARDVWMSAIGRMLPAVPLNPEPSNLPAPSMAPAPQADQITLGHVGPSGQPYAGPCRAVRAALPRQHPPHAARQSQAFMDKAPPR